VDRFRATMGSVERSIKESLPAVSGG
jgi:hypothetical protein